MWIMRKKRLFKRRVAINSRIDGRTPRYANCFILISKTTKVILWRSRSCNSQRNHEMAVRVFFPREKERWKCLTIVYKIYDNANKLIKSAEPNKQYELLDQRGAGFYMEYCAFHRLHKCNYRRRKQILRIREIVKSVMLCHLGKFFIAKQKHRSDIDQQFQENLNDQGGYELWEEEYEKADGT